MSLDERIERLEEAVENLTMSLEHSQRDAATLACFAAELLGRFAHDIGSSPDVGVPNQGDPLHDMKLAMILAYNREAGLS